MVLNLYHDDPSSEFSYKAFEKDQVLERLRVLDARARRKGLHSLDPGRNCLIPLGMEIDSEGRVTKNSYGVFHLSWQAAEHPEWAGVIEAELEEIRHRIKETHGCRLRFLIWAGMGGSAEDKAMYNAVGLLKRGPRCYVLDSTDPAKLRFILDDMVRRSGLKLRDVLKSTLVAGMAMGMTSYEPVVNLEKLAGLYEKYKIDSRSNFVYMTLPDSLLDRFASQRSYRKVELQLDSGNSTAGRHSSPLTRGSLYPLGLAGVDLRSWMEATLLTDEEIRTAWRLAAFLHRQGEQGRDKITLVLPKAWAGAGVWTKQDFEESLGKSEDLGLKLIIDEKVKLANYRPPADPAQDRVFLALQVKGLDKPDAAKISLLRRAGYPLAILNLERGALLSSYMQLIHYTVFGVAYLRKMNFVTQPSVELYKAITNRLYSEAQKAGGIENSSEWKNLRSSLRQAKYAGGVTICYPYISGNGESSQGLPAPAIYASLLKPRLANREVEYAELTFFGDTRYSPKGQAVRKSLHRVAETLFRARLKMPADVYEGPAMNHSFHEMIIGHGKCFSTVLLSEKQDRLQAAEYSPDYHMAQFLATQLALSQRGRAVVAILLRDLEEGTLASLEKFFREVGSLLKSGGV